MPRFADPNGGHRPWPVAKRIVMTVEMPVNTVAPHAIADALTGQSLMGAEVLLRVLYGEPTTARITHVRTEDVA